MMPSLDDALHRYVQDCTVSWDAPEQLTLAMVEGEALPA
jgi:hypothetical protein